MLALNKEEWATSTGSEGQGNPEIQGFQGPEVPFSYVSLILSPPEP